MSHNAQAAHAAEGQTAEQTQSTKRLSVSFFKNETRNLPSASGHITWQRFAEHLTNSKECADKSGNKLFAPYFLTPGTRRCNENVKAVHAAVIDSDSGIPFDSVRDRFSGLAFAAHSTYRNSPAEPRWRIVMPFLKPVDAEDWPACYVGLVDRFGEDIVDTGCKDEARIYYLPLHTRENADIRWAKTGEGEYLDPAPLIECGREILAAQKRPSSQIVAALNDDLTAHLSREQWPETAENVARVKSMLAILDPDPTENGNYEPWRNCVWAVADTGWECAEELARNWSKQGDKYDDAGFDNVWKSFKPAGGIGLGTLVHYAKASGWVDTQEAATPLDDGRGDILSGRAFAKMFRGKMLYAYPRGIWLRWDGARWIWCEGGEALQAAKSAAAALLVWAAKQAAPDTTSDKAKKLLRYAQGAQQLERLKAMQVCAASEDGMGISSLSALDADPWLLGCRNGVVNLRTGSFLAPDPSMYITRQCAAEYRRDATCPTWLQFLDVTFNGDADTVRYVQRALGYTLTGIVSEEVLHFCFGYGRNGKSVMANVVARIMHDYAMTAPADMLMRKDRSGPNNDIARLAGTRLVLANETRSDQRFDDLTIKTLVSTERISARFLNHEYFEFWPTFKIWVRGNHKPIVTDDTEGAWRRLRLVPFEHQVPEDEVDTDLEKKLLAESDGILAWMVEGARLWQKEGLKPSRVIAAASAQYRNDCDVLGEWLSDPYELSPRDSVKQRDAWKHFQGWCEENGLRPGAKKQFTRRLAERGVSSGGYLQGERAYVGLKRRDGMK